jgi:type I restriction enzyme S subunit
MTEWRRYRMRDVMAEFHDGPHATPAPAAEGPIFLGIKNITDAGALDLGTIRHIAEDDFAQWTRRVTPRPDDVVFTYEATLHRYALIPEGFRGCLGRRLALVRPNQDVVLPRFLHFAMLGPVWRATVTDRVISGSTVDRVPLIDFPDFPIDLPDTSTQRVVLEILGAIDDLIENNRRRVEVLEEMARAVYREWFVHFRYPGHETATFLDSPLGPIPQGWSASTCGDELISLGGGTPSKSEPTYWDDGTVRWYTPTDLTKSRCRYSAEPGLRITEAGLVRSSARLFPAGSVLMTSRATLGVLTIATTEATTNQGFIVIPPDKRWSPAFIFEWLDEHAAVLASIATGATFKEITKGAFKQVPFLVPAQDVLDAHRAANDPIEQEVRNLEQQVRSLASLRDLLLPILVTGQVDVSALDLDALVEDSVA